MYSAISKRHVQSSHEQVHVGRLLVEPYTVCCYFWTHSLYAECSVNYFLPFNKKCQINVLKFSFGL